MLLKALLRALQYAIGRPVRAVYLSLLLSSSKFLLLRAVAVYQRCRQRPCVLCSELRVMDLRLTSFETSCTTYSTVCDEEFENVNFEFKMPLSKTQTSWSGDPTMAPVAILSIEMEI